MYRLPFRALALRQSREKQDEEQFVRFCVQADFSGVGLSSEQGEARRTTNCEVWCIAWGGSRGGSGGSVELPKV